MFSAKNIIAIDTSIQEDFELANYLDFLATKIPIEKIVHLHILKSTSYAVPERIIKFLQDSIQKDRIAPLLESYKNINELEGLVKSGELIPELKSIYTKEKTNLLAVGKGEHTIRTIKNLIRHFESDILVVPKSVEYNLKTIFVPVDLSSHSGKLLDAAIALQEQSVYKFKIICYHAYEIPDVPYYNVLRTEKRMHKETQEIVRDAFDAFIAKYSSKEVNIVPVLYEEVNNWPSHYILKYINENPIDFVIMGTNNHSLMSAWFGSTVEKVITKNNKCPILIIK